jgi:hypothetical protein
VAGAWAAALWALGWAAWDWVAGAARCGEDLDTVSALLIIKWDS